MEKRRLDVDFRPETPKLDAMPPLPGPTVRLYSSLSAPGGQSLFSQPSINLTELFDRKDNERENVDEEKSNFRPPKEPAIPSSSASSPSALDMESAGRDPLQMLRALKQKLSFEKIDELTRPSETNEESRPPQDALPRFRRDETATEGAGETTFESPFPRLVRWTPVDEEGEAREENESTFSTKTASNQEERPALKPIGSGAVRRSREAVFRRKPEKIRPVVEYEEPECESIPIPNGLVAKVDSIPDHPVVHAGEVTPVSQEDDFVKKPVRSRGDEIIKTQDLRKSYSKGKIKIPVLNGVDFYAQCGEFVSIVGQSGSGKSTLLHLLGTLDNPDSGSIHFDGQRIDNLPFARRDTLRNRSIGFIFQFYHLLPEFTTLENVLSPLMIRDGVWSYLTRRRSYVERAKEILDQVGLSHRLKHRPNELSGGEMQRAAIARSLVSDPKILLADEPTGNLDSASAREIIDILRKLNEEQHLTIVMVTHDNLIAQAADRMVRMVDGVIVRRDEFPIV